MNFDPIRPWYVSEWPRPWRRAFVILLPISVPLWFVTMIGPLLVTCFVEMGADIWKAIRKAWR
jgi:hypothetical protein